MRRRLYVPLSHINKLTNKLRPGQGTPEDAQQTAQPPEKTDGEVPEKEEDPEAKVAKPAKGDFFNTWGRIRNIFREFLGELLGVSPAL